MPIGSPGPTLSRLRIRRSPALTGAAEVPGDKSITHRAVIIAAIAEGSSRIRNPLGSGSCQATMDVVRSLGVEIHRTSPNELLIHGRGLRGLKPHAYELDCANSGTTMRLLSGILAAQGISCRLTGGDQILRRPMSRIVYPLCAMGANVRDHGGYPPIDIGPPHSGLVGIKYRMPIGSAQLKSCLLLAGLWADGSTTVYGAGRTRDHTERLLAAVGAEISLGRDHVTVDRQTDPLQPLDITVPGDMSSAAFLIAAASIVPGSELSVLGVGINPTRTGIIDALIEMGASIEMNNLRAVGVEPVADITVRHAPLRGATFEGDRIVTMIDELPVLAVVATQATGTTTIRDAAELRIKESDRIAATATELRRLGGKVAPIEDGLIIEGGNALRGDELRSHHDHRLAMALAIAGIVASGETIINDTQVISDSFPDFLKTLASCGAVVEAI